jgi:hypothetical protein
MYEERVRLRITCDTSVSATWAPGAPYEYAQLVVEVGSAVPTISLTASFRLHNAIDSLWAYKIVDTYVTNRMRFLGTSLPFLEDSRVGLVIKRETRFKILHWLKENYNRHPSTHAWQMSRVHKRDISHKNVCITKLYTVYQLLRDFRFETVRNRCCVCADKSPLAAETWFHIGPNCVCLTHTRSGHDKLRCGREMHPRPDIGRISELTSST